MVINQKKDFWNVHFDKWIDLDPPSRLSEVLFGLIMVLSFTGTISISTAGRQDLRELIWAALGCNLAWGLVDAIMYIMDTLISRNRDIVLLNKIREGRSPDALRESIRNRITPLIADIINDDEVDGLYEKIKQLPEVTIKNSLTRVCEKTHSTKQIYTVCE